MQQNHAVHHSASWNTLIRNGIGSGLVGIRCSVSAESGYRPT